MTKNMLLLTLSKKLTAYVALLYLVSFINTALADFELSYNNDTKQLTLHSQDEILLYSPPEGFWSVATKWENQWSSGWLHAPIAKLEKSGDWTIYSGLLDIRGDKLKLRDACRKEPSTRTPRFKCVRRIEWHGKTTLDQVTLAIRWLVPTTSNSVFIPAVMYHGNPSGRSTFPERVPHLHGDEGEIAIFEEHRPAAPLVSLEWSPKAGKLYGAALHSLPSLVPSGNLNDQWWSIGMERSSEHTEFKLLSGPVAYNRTKSIAKALKYSHLPYPDAFMRLNPGDIVEKTYYLEAYTVKKKGQGFQQAFRTAVDIFKPFYYNDFPSMREIVENKLAFMESRWEKKGRVRGFNTYDKNEEKSVIGLGWVGQAAAPAYALQHLEDYLPENKIVGYVQQSMDFISKSKFSKDGYAVDFDLNKNKWDLDSPYQSYVAQAQGLFNMMRAIKSAESNKQYKTKNWKKFTQKALTIHANRILKSDWRPESTNEAFFIAPLLLADSLYKNKNNLFRSAALKAADHYIARHLSMDEPYWGGTLDATGEDKEGAWAAFQGFYSAYEATGKQKYLDAASHAADVVLSYVVLWDIPMPAGRLNNHGFKTRGWTAVSPQNHHLDVYGVLIAPWLYKLADAKNDNDLKNLAIVMYRSCGQMIDPYGSHGEQMLQTNYAQRYRGKRVRKGDILLEQMRGDYAEMWNVTWISAHFLVGAAMFEEMGVKL